MYKGQGTKDKVRWARYKGQGTKDNVQRTMYKGQCTKDNVQRTRDKGSAAAPAELWRDKRILERDFRLAPEVISEARLPARLRQRRSDIALRCRAMGYHYEERRWRMKNAPMGHVKNALSERVWGVLWGRDYEE